MLNGKRAGRQLGRGRGLVWQLLAAGPSSSWGRCGKRLADKSVRRPTFPSPTRNTAAMDSFAELRELKSLFDSGVLARDA